MLLLKLTITNMINHSHLVSVNKRDRHIRNDIIDTHK